MAGLLYLDTARLGRMSPSARRAHQDFVALAGEEGGSLYFDRFLQLGASSLHPGRYPGLGGWHGIAALKRCLRGLAGASPELPVLIASRSAQLMKLAARLLFHPCRNVLVTDPGWPSYHEILSGECRRSNRSVTAVPVRQSILERRAGEEEVADHVCAEFRRHRCDGLFLTAVSNLGIRLPVERIVQALEATGQLRLVVLDGAQDFCHVGTSMGSGCCDLYITGSHKWLGAYQPLGLGFYGRSQSRGFIETVLDHMTAVGDLDDPLLRFTGRLEAGSLDGVAETVNLAPLFACQGAVADVASTDNSVRLENSQLAADLASETGWSPLLPEQAFRSGMLLLQARRTAARGASPAGLRAAFHDRGIALTAYEDAVIRLSMPGTSWSPEELNTLRTALRATA